MKTLTAEEFDELAESGADISEYLDWDKATRGDSKRINIDVPIEFLAALDREAALRGVTRQSLIKVWLYERLQGSTVRAYGTSLQTPMIFSGGGPSLLDETAPRFEDLQKEWAALLQKEWAALGVEAIAKFRQKIRRTTK
jgi:hypothetical protein